MINISNTIHKLSYKLFQWKFRFLYVWLEFKHNTKLYWKLNWSFFKTLIRNPKLRTYKEMLQQYHNTLYTLQVVTYPFSLSSDCKALQEEIRYQIWKRKGM